MGCLVALHFEARSAPSRLRGNKSLNMWVEYRSQSKESESDKARKSEKGRTEPRSCRDEVGVMCANHQDQDLQSWRRERVSHTNPNPGQQSLVNS